MKQVRAERSLEGFSRGAELVKSICKVRLDHPPGSKVPVHEAIEELRSEYDLTYNEWYYWSGVAATAGSARRYG